MTNIALRVASPPSLTSEVTELAVGMGGTASEPQPSSSSADPLNAPISGGDIQAAAEVVTVVFTAGSSALTFLKGLLDLVTRKEARVEVSSKKHPRPRTLTGPKDIDDLVE